MIVLPSWLYCNFSSSKPMQIQ